MGAVAQHYTGKVQAIEIWNEQDEGHFWIGGPNPAAYVNVLQRSYTAIKAADPSVKVVFGPTVGNNYGFVDVAWSYAFAVLAVFYAAFGPGWCGCCALPP